MKATLETPLTRLPRAGLVWLEGSAFTTVVTTPAGLTRDAPAAHRVTGAALIRGRRARGLRAQPDRGVRAAQTTLGDIKVPIGAERQPARIVQARREDRDNRGVVAQLLVAGGRLGASGETDAAKYYSCCFSVCDRAAAQRGSWSGVAVTWCHLLSVRGVMLRGRPGGCCSGASGRGPGGGGAMLTSGDGRRGGRG